MDLFFCCKLKGGYFCTLLYRQFIQLASVQKFASLGDAMSQNSPTNLDDVSCTEGLVTVNLAEDQEQAVCCRVDTGSY